MSSFLEEVISVLGREVVSADPQTLANIGSNTLGSSKTVCGVFYPKSVEQIVALVRMAQAHGVGLYPISCGKNLGYGDATPVQDGHFLVDLSRMNRIREIDPEGGYAVVEPGVTQLQLYQALQKLDPPLIADMTGAGYQASIIGNSLEGGFGHTPLGNHRLTSSDFEVVLGTGELLRTGDFPGPGPDLAGMFVQSNFGIVTAMRIELMPKPQSFVSFIAECRDSKDISEFFQELGELRREGVLTSLVHVANALRSFMTLKSCPDAFQNKIMSNAEAKEFLSFKFLRVGDWTAVGGLYGSKEMTKALAAQVERRLKRFGSVRLMTDRRLDFAQWLLSRTPLAAFGVARDMSSTLALYRPVHDLMQGVPSDVPLQHIGWKESDQEDMGLIWCAPVCSLKPEKLLGLLNTAKDLFTEHGLEMPVTVTLIDGAKVVCTLSIHFNLRDPEAVKNAHSLYNALLNSFAEKEILPYRQSILAFSMDHQFYSDEKLHVLQKLKQCFDPNNVISRGRYGI